MSEDECEPPAELDALVRQVIGAAIEVHKHHKAGYPEAVYRDSLAIELQLRGMKVEREVPVTATYKGNVVGRWRIDLLVEGKLIVELKTVEALSATHVAQMLTYLKATGRQLGLLINFQVPAIRGNAIKRVIYRETE